VCGFADNARCEVCELNGVERLYELLTRLLTENSELTSTLRKVACGFLFNLTNTHGVCHINSILNRLLLKDLILFISMHVLMSLYHSSCAVNSSLYILCTPVCRKFMSVLIFLLPV
jgi:hypothetical protein